MKPTVSIILPIFNGELYLKDAVDSLLCQTFEDFELLLINDGSSDSTAEICHQFAQADSRVNVIKKPNTGLVDTLNLGLLRAKGMYIARMDADDISYPHRFERQIDFIEFTGCSAVSAGYIHIDEYGNVLNLSLPQDVNNANCWWIPAKEPYLSHPFLFAKREDLINIGGYRHVFYSEDADLYWRLVRNSRVANSMEVIGCYRVHSRSISGKATLNGRVQAVFAHLAAVDQQRFYRRENPLVFNYDLDIIRNNANSLLEVCSFFEGVLSKSEFSYLKAASGVKLIETARWRGYIITEDDILFTSDALKEFDNISNENKAEALATVRDMSMLMYNRRKS